MKNVDTGVFTIIPESEEVDSATHHNYILNKEKSTVGDGCGTAATDVFVCSVCSDEYTVYKTIAHNQNYNLSYEFIGTENNCESGVTIKYSCSGPTDVVILVVSLSPKRRQMRTA